MRSPRKKPTLLALAISALFTCGTLYSGYSQLYDVNIKSPSFEDNFGNPSFDGWRFSGSNQFFADVPEDGGTWSFKCNSARAENYSLELNAAYQPITGLPNGSHVFVWGCIKVQENNAYLSGDPSIGLAILRKNGDWTTLCSRNVSENRWMGITCYNPINISPSDTLVVFLNPGFTENTENIPVVLFDKLTVKYDSTSVNVSKHEIKGLNIFPNPIQVNDNLIVSYESRSACDLRLTSAHGISKVIKSNISAGKHTESISLADYLPGIYFLSVESRTGIRHKKIIIQ